MNSNTTKTTLRYFSLISHKFLFCHWTFFVCILSAANLVSATPFKIYWNVPSANCGFLNLTKKYGITANTNETFKPGDEIVIFYDHEFGQIPFYDKKSNEYRFGGIPQFGRWEDHIQQLKKDVERLIPDEDFQGLAILDWEEWRPRWATMWRGSTKFWPYQDLSIRKAQRDHPRARKNLRLAEIWASLEWDQAANKWLRDTLNVCKQLRPKANWGYYHFPDCFQYKDKDCKEIAIDTHDYQYAWMWKYQDAYFPCGYHGLSSVEAVASEISRIQKRRKREIRMKRTMRLKRRLKRNHRHPHENDVVKETSFGSFTRGGHFRPHGPIADKPWFLYVKFSEEASGGSCYKAGSSYLFHDLNRLMNSIGYAWVHGATGVILWDSSCFYKKNLHPRYCNDLREYLDSILGPLSRTLIKSKRPHFNV